MTKSLLVTWSTLAVCALLSACESGNSIRIIERGGSGAYSNGGAGALPDLNGDPTPRTDGCPEDAPLPVDGVRIWPATGQAAMLVGAKIQGSNDGPTTDFVDLATIEVAPTENAYTWVTFENTQRYRYLRYYAPSGSQGGVAELEFYYGNRLIKGSAFGTAVETSMYSSALDGNPSTYFAATTSGGGYVGLDIAGTNAARRVTFSPSITSSTTPIDLELASATASAMIHYTVNGDEPTADVGTLYTAPFQLDYGTWQVRAVAFGDCLFDSQISSSTYVIDPNAKPNTSGFKSYHIGNSLTDTINHWLKPIADSTGVNHTYARWTIPGAPIAWLVEHMGEGFGDPEGATQFDTFVQSFAPIDHMSIQPYSDPAWNIQGPAAVQLLTKALAYSPNVQFWIYAQWPSQKEWSTSKAAFSNGGGTVFPPWQVLHKPTTWEEATENEVLYHEAFLEQIQPSVGGKPILIIPGGLALVELKRQFEAGMIPDMSGDFWSTFFEDEVHLAPKAQYLIALVFYACIYQLPPEARVTHEGTGLTAEQAAIFQRIAWNVANAYPHSGL